MESNKSKWRVTLFFITFGVLAFVFLRAGLVYHSGQTTQSHDITFAFDVSWHAHTFEQLRFEEKLSVEKNGWKNVVSVTDLPIPEKSNFQALVTKDGNDVYIIVKNANYHLDMVHQKTEKICAELALHDLDYVGEFRASDYRADQQTVHIEISTQDPGTIELWKNCR